MKILLVNAPFTYPRPRILRLVSLGQLYLAAALRERGFEIAVYDPTLGLPLKTAGGFYFGVAGEKIEAVMRSARPDMVGLTCNNAFSLQGAELVARLVFSLNIQKLK